LARQGASATVEFKKGVRKAPRADLGADEDNLLPLIEDERCNNNLGGPLGGADDVSIFDMLSPIIAAPRRFLQLGGGEYGAESVSPVENPPDLSPVDEIGRRDEFNEDIEGEYMGVDDSGAVYEDYGVDSVSPAGNSPSLSPFDEIDASGVTNEDIEGVVMGADDSGVVYEDYGVDSVSPAGNSPSLSPIDEIDSSDGINNDIEGEVEDESGVLYEEDGVEPVSPMNGSPSASVDDDDPGLGDVEVVNNESFFENFQRSESEDASDGLIYYDSTSSVRKSANPSQQRVTRKNAAKKKGLKSSAAKILREKKKKARNFRLKLSLRNYAADQAAKRLHLFK
jgi:hypothetical protein